MSKLPLLAAAGVGVILLAVLLGSPSAHSEEALLTDWSAPPPWPIFIAVNVLAGTLRSMADALTPPPIRMIDMGFAYQTSKLAQVCMSFKIADFLATGPKTLAEIAEYTQTQDVLRVERFMYALAADGITQLDPSLKQGERPVRFVNTALSATLRRDHPNSMAGMIGHQVMDAYEAFGRIEKVLGPDPIDIPWDEVYNDPKYRGGKIWKYYEDHPDREEQFGRAMNSLEGLGGMAMAEDVPFHKFSRVIDVGGSRGHFLYKILNRNPKTTGILFDRAPVLENAKALWNSNDGAFHDGTEKRLEMVTGDFFQAGSIPQGQDGDAYLMRYILHDWGENEVLQILSNLYESMKGKKTTLLIGECSIPDRDVVGVPSAMYKIDMLMMNLFGGALERTPEMWKSLLDSAGFEFVTIHPTRSLVHFVEARPKAIQGTL